MGSASAEWWQMPAVHSAHRRRSGVAMTLVRRAVERSGSRLLDQVGRAPGGPVCAGRDPSLGDHAVDDGQHLAALEVGRLADGLDGYALVVQDDDVQYGAVCHVGGDRPQFGDGYAVDRAGRYAAVGQLVVGVAFQAAFGDPGVELRVDLVDRDVQVAHLGKDVAAPDFLFGFMEFGHDLPDGTPVFLFLVGHSPQDTADEAGPGQHADESVQITFTHEGS